jgi:hypothetical protein
MSANRGYGVVVMSGFGRSFAFIGELGGDSLELDIIYI